MTAPSLRRLLPTLAVTAGVVCANLYYCQPLLVSMGESLGVSPSVIGGVPAVTQLGYGAGMLVLVPLGDRFERRRLILLATLASAVVALIVAAAHSLTWLLFASFTLGLASMVPQYIVPYAATVAPKGQHGRAVGVVMMGLLIGILLSRTLAGYLGEHFGWRSAYVVAAGLCAVVLVALRVELPEQHPETRLTLREVYVSTLAIARAEPVLRHHSLLGACSFGAFSVFWSTLAFHLATPPHPYGSTVVGAFGVVGILGAIAAPLVGRFADRQGPKLVNVAAILTLIVSFGVFALAGKSLLGIAVGVVLLDLGVQSNHLANQARIFGMDASKRSRINTVYMTSYFAGGAIGSWLGAVAWTHGGWMGVCAAGAAVACVALMKIVLFRSDKSAAQE